MRSSWKIGSGLAFAAIFASGCTPPPCDSAINPSGAHYEVDIHGIYDISDVYSTNQGWLDSTGAPSCGGSDGLGPAAVLQFQTVGPSGTGNGPCENAKAVLTTAPAALTIDGVAATAPPFTSTLSPDIVMFSLMDVTFAGCSGVELIQFYAGPGNVFAAPRDAGGKEPAVMYRLFNPSSTSCTRCQDNFVVQFVDLAKDRTPIGD